jgi:hypothetical protein
VVTSVYLASPWCTAEVGIARSQGSRLLPLLAEPGVVHPLLTSMQYANLERDPDAARAALGAALRRVDVAGGLGWPDDRLIPFNPLRKVKAPRRGVDPEVVFGLVQRPTFSPQEFGRLLAACPPFYRDHFIVHVGSGLRSGELLGLRPPRGPGAAAYRGRRGPLRRRRIRLRLERVAYAAGCGSGALRLIFHLPAPVGLEQPLGFGQSAPNLLYAGSRSAWTVRLRMESFSGDLA